MVNRIDNLIYKGESFRLPCPIEVDLDDLSNKFTEGHDLFVFLLGKSISDATMAKNGGRRMRLVDVDLLRERMYHEAFEKDSDLQRWDGGCWIRYKLFENVVESMPIVDVPDREGESHD